MHWKDEDTRASFHKRKAIFFCVLQGVSMAALSRVANTRIPPCYLSCIVPHPLLSSVGSMLFVTMNDECYLRHADCEVEGKMIINEWPLTAWEMGFLLRRRRLRPPEFNAHHPIICSIEFECGTRQMGDFVCVLAVWVRVWVGERVLRSGE